MQDLLFKKDESVSLKVIIETLLDIDINLISEDEIDLYRMSLINLVNMGYVEITGYDEEGYEVVKCTDEGYLFALVSIFNDDNIAEA